MRLSAKAKSREGIDLGIAQLSCVTNLRKSPVSFTLRIEKMVKNLLTFAANFGKWGVYATPVIKNDSI